MNDTHVYTDELDTIHTIKPWDNEAIDKKKKKKEIEAHVS